jgi:hypothetical protein
MSALPNAALARSQSSPASGTASRASRNLALGYLRTFAVILVLAHHSALAYLPGLPPARSSLLARPRWWTAFPILDSQRWIGFEIFAGFNDAFFMSLLFFLSGLFVWSSLERKGTRIFMRDRMIRLAIPFLFAALVVAPLAYYPAYASRSSDPSAAGFMRQWFALGEWPAGPAWFIWVLLMFDCVAAAVFVMAPEFGARLGKLSSGANRHPARFFLLLVVTSLVAYVPMVVLVGPDHWVAIGPLHFQTSRIFHYAVYFFMGVGVGLYGIQLGLLAPDAMLARHWARWTVLMPVAFVLLGSFLVSLPSLARALSPAMLGLIGGALFELSCAASCFGLMALFVRFARRRTPLRDSLSENEYGIYLVHYAFVSWLGYAMLPAPLPAVGKFALVFIGTLLLSWGASAALRRIPAVARAV